MARRVSVNGHSKPANRSVGRVNVAAIRREQIVDAAAEIISLHGIQNLSLSEIETRTGMSRGQLTYYFREKELILLAVFDRTVERMRSRMAADREFGEKRPLAHFVLDSLLKKPASTDFIALQYAFLAQMNHRRDFRERLADLFGGWREALAADVPKSDRSGYKPKTLAAFVQAVFHGLVMQRQADPESFASPEMMRLCRHVFDGVFGVVPPPKKRRRVKKEAGDARRR